MARIALILDVDGVVLDYNPLMRKILIKNNEPFKEDPDSWYSFGLPRTRALDAVMETWNDPGFAKLKPLEGFLDYYSLIKDQYNIFYCSNVRSEKGKISRIKNLLNLGIYHPIFFSKNAQEKANFIKQLSGPKIFIDDKPINVKTVKEISPDTRCYWFNHKGRMTHKTDEHMADMIMTNWLKL